MSSIISVQGPGAALAIISLPRCIISSAAVTLMQAMSQMSMAVIGIQVQPGSKDRDFGSSILGTWTTTPLLAPFAACICYRQAWTGFASSQRHEC